MITQCPNQCQNQCDEQRTAPSTNMMLVSGRCALCHHIVCNSSFHRSRAHLPRPGVLGLGVFELALVLAAFLPDTANAHAADRGYILLLPTTLTMVGGTLAVILTVLLCLFIKRPSTATRHVTVNHIQPATTPVPATVLRTLSAVIVLCLIVTGFRGNPDPLSNLLPLTVWTLWWVLLTAAHAIFGRLWYWIDPFAGIAACVRRVIGQSDSKPRLNLTPAVGYPIAALGLLGFGWFELVSLQPEDPPTLAIAVLCYTVYSVSGNLIFGERAWRRYGDAFAVFFDFIATLKPWAYRATIPQRNDHGDRPTHRPHKFGLTWPASQVLSQPAPHWTACLVILVALSLVSFDGLNKTFWWLHLHEINPLAFAGRSSMTLINSAGLVVFASALLLAFLITQWFAWLISGRQTTLAHGVAVFGLSLIPISLAYHVAHYLTLALVNGQYWLKALADPLSMGWNLTGFADHTVTTSFLSNHHAVEIIWYLQTTLIVAGHCLAVVVSHQLALTLYDRHRTAVIAQLPLTMLMVFFTAFGLWLLSAPTGL